MMKHSKKGHYKIIGLELALKNNRRRRKSHLGDENKNLRKD